MFRASRAFLFIVHSPRGINFKLSADEALEKVGDKYSRRWFGAKLDFLDVKKPSKEFLPFYFCSGDIDAVFTARVGYEQRSADAKGNSRTTTSYQSFGPARLRSIFDANQTQIYAGYKYNITHVEAALCTEQNPIDLQKMNRIDTAGATINLFEQSTSTMHTFVDERVRAQATESARSMVRAAHPMADSISITFTDFKLTLAEVMPVFLPCYVVQALYDEQAYSLYVSGTNGTVSGPFLLNALYVGRVTGLATLGVFLLVTPNKVAGLIFGSVAAIAAYYAGFFGAKYFPSWRRDRNRKAREELRRKHEDRDTSGYRPNSRSQRVRQEYHRSTYWDQHKYQQKKGTAGSGGGSSSSSSSGSGSQGASGSSSSASSTAFSRDPKGYYRILELKGDESVNEIRSAYRKLVLAKHPDVGGSDAEMAKLNEAYRVLRDPERRAQYDRQ